MSTQCPNCGGYKVSTTTTSVGENREFFSMIMDKRTLIPGIVIGLIVGVVATIRNPLEWAYTFCYPILIPILFAVIAGFINGITSRIKRQPNRFERLPIVQDHNCALCGYQWRTGTGISSPKVTVRPDLIRRGAERLEEERRRRDD